MKFRDSKSDALVFGKMNGWTVIFVCIWTKLVLGQDSGDIVNSLIAHQDQCEFLDCVEEMTNFNI